MSLLQVYSTPAERRRGASWADRFESQALVERNGGAVSGAPTFSPDGVVLDGAADYLTYNLTGREFDSSGVTIVCEFTPDFNWNEDVERVFFDTTDTDRYLLFKRNNANSNVLRLFLGSVVIENIAAASYSAYWIQGKRNILAISGTTGDTSAWLNGNLILNSDASAWSRKTPTQLSVGSYLSGLLKFHGTIHRIQVYKTQLSDAECIDISTNTIYGYRNEATLLLPMGIAEHDPANVRTLDVSGNENHATFGDGSTPATYPTKTARRHGYTYDGGDYLVTDIPPPAGSFSAAALFVLDDVAGENVILGHGTITGNLAGWMLQNSADNNDIGFYLTDDGTLAGGHLTSVVDTAAVIPGQLIFAAVTYKFVSDGASIMRLYVDDRPMVEDTAANGPVYSGAPNLVVGAQGDVAWPMTGDIIECRYEDGSVWTPMQVEDIKLRMKRQANRT